VFSRGGGGERRNHEIEVERAKIRAGNAGKAVPDRFSNLSDITNTATTIKRE
jgi:hypothetical protein